MLNSHVRVVIENLYKRSKLFRIFVAFPVCYYRLWESLISVLMLIFWFLFVLVPFKIARIIAKRRTKSSQSRAPLKALFLTYEGYAVAPARIRCYKFCEEIKKRGVEGEVFAFWKEMFNCEGIYSGFPFMPRLTFVSIKATHRLLKHDFQIIDQQRPNYDLITSIALKWLTGAKLIFDIDDWTHGYAILFPFRIKHLRWLLGKVGDGIIVSSRRLQEDYSHYFKKIYLIPTYVDMASFVPKKFVQKTPVVFSWNGTLFHDINYDSVLIMVYAFAKACDQLESFKDVRLEIVGGGSYLPVLQKTIGEKFGKYPIVVKNWLDPDDMPKYLHSVDVGLYSLRIGDIFSEIPLLTDFKLDKYMHDFVLSKSPTKVFEYMACGLPCISTAIGESHHFIEQGITGLYANDLLGLSQHIVALAIDPAVRERMGQAAYEKCRTSYTLSCVGESLAKILNDLWQ